MKNEIFTNISKIIERDSKVTTYKFALLRGVIDIIQDNSPYITFSEDRVHFPLGLLIEKWMIYYYPILDSSIAIPQINAKKNLAFETQLKKIISAYRGNNGLSAFYNDMRNKGIPRHLQNDFLTLAKKLGTTITDMPMRHIGFSINNCEYSIFLWKKGNLIRNPERVDLEYLITNFGTFSIPLDYYKAFQILGSFISGQDSILFKWAEFSVNASDENLSIERVVSNVLKSPITERDVKASKNLYKSILEKDGKVYCVWTGKAITTYDVDHIIPFSIWKNNDLWNLLPSQTKVNNQKRDKIPSVRQIEMNKDLILHYWELINKFQSQRFEKEIQVTLLGNSPFSDSNWQTTAIQQLQNSCNYLISNRGFQEWNI